MKQVVKWLYRRLPFSVAVALARGNPNLAYHIPPGPRNILVKSYLGEFDVQIDTISDVERRMLSKTYEPTTQAIISRFVTKGQCAFDVGANVGAVALALAKAVGPTGRVDAFEPGPPIFAKLERNIRLNPTLTWVNVHQLGMGEREGDLSWQESATDPGNATIHWADPARPTVPVKISTIDTFVREQRLTALHFVKIDVEGMELSVLKGAVGSIERHRPILFFESSMSDDQQRAATRELEKLLDGFKYRLYKLDQRGAIVETRYPDLSFETLALPPHRLNG